MGILSHSKSLKIKRFPNVTYVPKIPTWEIVVFHDDESQQWQKKSVILLFKLKEIMYITKGMINRFQGSINMQSQPWILSRLLCYLNLPNSFHWEKKKVRLHIQNQQRKSYSLLTLEMNIPEVSVPALISVGLNPGQQMSNTFPVQMFVFLKLFPWTMRWEKK